MNDIIKRIKNSSVVNNSVWLMLLQGVNTVLPMITIPYITRILGAKGYGMFSAAQNWIFYFQVIVEYGFELWGARKVALLSKGEKKELNQVFSEILSARILLCIVSFVFMCIISLILGISKPRFLCQIILYTMIFGCMLQLSWLFQGKENMKPITIVNVIARTISVALIFLFVKEADSLYLYTFLYSITYIISAVSIYRMARKEYNLHFCIIPYSDIIHSIKDAWYVFISSALIKIFSGIALSILTIVSTDYFVGVYSAISKIPFILVMLFSPISQALYPNIAKRYKESFSDGVSFVERIAIPIVGVYIAISVMLIIFRTNIVMLLFGEEYVKYSNIVIFLLIQTIFAIYNNFVGVQTLVASGNQKYYSRAFSRSAIFMIFIYFIAYRFFHNEQSLYAVSCACAFTEAILTVFLHVEKYKLKISNVAKI